MATECAEDAPRLEQMGKGYGWWAEVMNKRARRHLD